MKKWIVLGILSVLVIGMVMMSGCTSPSPAAIHTTPITAGPTTPTVSGDWKFVVFADSPDPAENTTTGVSPALMPIAKAIAAEKPDLALYMGDLVNGWELTNASPMAGNYTGQFENWMKYVTPIHNYTDGTGIPLYVIRGNHEDGPNQTVVPLLNSYLATAAAGMPANGPPGEEKLTYSVTHKGAKFVMNDNYIEHNGLKETVNQSWVNGQLTQDIRPFTFVFGHSPAYAVAVDDPKENAFSIDVHTLQRDIFWKSMVDNNVSAYFSGHAHLYVRGENQGILQIVSGNAGAHALAFDPVNVDPALTLISPKKTIAKDDQRVGYLVFTVHESTGTVDGIEKQLNPGTHEWENVDTFTIRNR